jgi:glycosyltransferase involved in cell wall biosynthesis
VAPRISCIIPVFNGKKTITRALDSVLAQEAAQAVLVDDASTDGSSEFILELAARDPRVVAMHLKRNRGQSYARNVGAAAADAPYITFLDQDDEHIPGWYEHAVEKLEENTVCAGIKGNFQLADVPAAWNLVVDDPRLPAVRHSVIWNLVVRKVVYQALGGCPTTTAFRVREGNEDYALMTALARHFELLHTEYLACRHYVTPNGATDYFFTRTRVVGSRFEFAEKTLGEEQGELQKQVDNYRARAEANLNALTVMLKRGARKRH